MPNSPSGNLPKKGFTRRVGGSMNPQSFEAQLLDGKAQLQQMDKLKFAQLNKISSLQKQNISQQR
jgi:hypothetical protein